MRPAPSTPAPPDAGAPDAGGPDAGTRPPGTPDAGGADGGPCLACADFEAGGVAVSQPSCSGAGSVAVEAGVAHSGRQALHVHGVAGYCNHAFARWVPTALPPTFWVRFWVLGQAAFGPGHLTFLAMRDEAAGGKDLRMGDQSGILMFNREADDATLPALSPQGISLSRALVPGAWTCVEVAVDQPAATLRTFVDGAPVAGLTLDGVPTPDVDQQWLQGAFAPSLSDLRLGFESYASEAGELWFDDLEVRAGRPGCGP